MSYSTMRKQTPRSLELIIDSMSPLELTRDTQLGGRTGQILFFIVSAGFFSEVTLIFPLEEYPLTEFENSIR